MICQDGKPAVPVKLRDIEPVKHYIVFDIVPSLVICVLQPASAYVERGILPQPRRREGRGEPDVELVASVVAGAAVPSEGVPFAVGADADVMPPVDSKVEIDLRVAPAQGDRLRKGGRGDGAADADTLYKVVVAEQDDFGRALRRGARGRDISPRFSLPSPPSLSRDDPLLPCLSQRARRAFPPPYANERCPQLLSPLSVICFAYFP